MAGSERVVFFLKEAFEAPATDDDDDYERNIKKLKGVRTQLLKKRNNTRMKLKKIVDAFKIIEQDLDTTQGDIVRMEQHIQEKEQKQLIAQGLRRT